MASGALPPGFPAVAIEEPGPIEASRASGAPRPVHYYWDGGLVSNTPLTQVLDDHPRRDTLAFQVDLWSARGEVPTNVVDAQERVKDIQFSSRTRAITNMQAQEQRQRRMLREMLEQIPPEAARVQPGLPRRRAQATARCVSVIQLIYQDKEWDGLSKDYEFGAVTMRNHWESGLTDINNDAGASALAGAAGGRRSVRDARHSSPRRSQRRDRQAVILRAVAGSTQGKRCPARGSCDCAQDDVCES